MRAVVDSNILIRTMIEPGGEDQDDRQKPDDAQLTIYLYFSIFPAMVVLG